MYDDNYEMVIMMMMTDPQDDTKFLNKRKKKHTHTRTIPFYAQTQNRSLIRSGLQKNVLYDNYFICIFCL